VFESDIETAYHLWIFLRNGEPNLKLFWSVKPWPGVSPRTFMLSSGNYASWRYFTRHLPSDIEELTKSFGMLRHHDNSRHDEDQPGQNRPSAIDPGPAGILRSASRASEGVGSNPFCASVACDKSSHSNLSFHEYHEFLKKNSGGLIFPLSAMEEIVQIVKSLDSLYFEETITSSPEIHASFLPGHKIWLRISRLNKGVKQ
jgi:hypothetical protein